MICLKVLLEIEKLKVKEIIKVVIKNYKGKNIVKDFVSTEEKVKENA